MFNAHSIELTNNELMLLNLTLLCILGWIIIKTESKINTKNEFFALCLILIFAIFGRILLNPIPNVQPVTVLILMTGVYFGASRSIVLASLVALISNMYIGHGIWTFYQAGAWSVIGVIGAIFSSKIISENKININALASLAIFSGFLFGWIVSLSALHSIPIELMPVYLLTGIPYDLLHAVGNLAFVAWLANPISKLMHKHVQFPSHIAVKNFDSR